MISEEQIYEAIETLSTLGEELARNGVPKWTTEKRNAMDFVRDTAATGVQPREYLQMHDAGHIAKRAARAVDHLLRN